MSAENDAPTATSLPTTEVLKSLSNRFLFSHFYLYLYLSMTLLSLLTFVVSLMSPCPTPLFYLLEFIINATMILEVTIRLIGFGSKFWASYYNSLDLAITVLCVVTLAVIFFAGKCEGGSEERFDTILLIVRNFFQLLRLGLVMKKSGGIRRVEPINFSDIYEGEEEADEEHVAGEQTRKKPDNVVPEGRPFLIDSDEEE